MTPSAARLASELEERKDALSRRCIDAMYRDPFWMARFGERGRRHAEEDAAYHVEYVVAALRSEEVALFERYARWLRTVLVVRGMCSWHLAESFRQLASALYEERVPEPEAALAVLHAGRAALSYGAPRAAPFEDRAAELEALRARLGADACRLDELWSFTLDSWVRGDAAPLRAHLEFLRRSVLTAPGDDQRLTLTLRALRQLLASESAPELADWLGRGGAD